MIITNSYGPLKSYLPLTLADSALGVRDKNRDKAARELNDQASIKEKESQRRRRESSFGKPDAYNEKATVRSRDYAASESTARRPGVVRTDDLERGRGQAADVPEGAPDAVDDLAPGIDEEEGPKDFYHPASVEPQPVVWIPKDN